MVQKLNKLYYTICYIAIASIPVAAIAQNDSTKTNRDKIDVKEYILQKRYIPEGRNVVRNNGIKNYSIGLFGGIGKILNKDAQMPMTKEFGISLTKDVNSFNSYRISFMGGANNLVTKFGAEIDHIFNIQDYITGWNGNRVYSIQTVWGLGVYGAKPDNGKTELAGGAHGGFIYTRRLGKHLDIYLEPRLNLYSDMIDARYSERRYDVSAQALFGFKYRFHELPYANFKDNAFYEIYAGVNGDFSDRTWNSQKMRTLGPNAGISLGRWFYPIGIKATGFAGFRNVPGPNLKGSSEEPYAGVRLEGMVNLNTLFAGPKEDMKFEVNVTGGYEAGLLAHKGTGVYSKKIMLFKGPTASLQALYFVRPELGIFAQARWSKNIYTQNYTDGSAEERFMRNMGIELGVQYRRRYSKVQELKNKYAFEPYNFVFAQLGTNFPLHTSKISSGDFGQQYAIGVGRRYSKIAAVRGTIEAARFGTGAYPFTISGDLMIDALTAMGGYNPERTVSVLPFAGILYSHNEAADKNNFGINGGADLMFKISDLWNIYAEGAVRMYKGKIAKNARVYSRAGFSFVPNASIGVMYKF